jgi:aryl-alcohol dehydrogenase-like predicted oxidoreductase
MQYRRLGQTEIEVSVLCLGTMTFGEQNTEAEAHQQLDRALELGVNFIDTAELYAIPPRAETQGLTEEYIGSWLKQRGDRERIVVATKASGSGDWVNYIRGGPRLNRGHLIEAVNDSLKRLHTDYIDLYQTHWPERQTNYFSRLGYSYGEQLGVPIEETLRALEELVGSGKVRHVGVSNETPWGVSEHLRVSEREGLPRIVSVQNPYSLLNRAFEIGLAEFSHRESVGLLAYSPMAMGMLSGKYLNGQRPPGGRLTLFERFTRYGNPPAVAATHAYASLARQAGLEPSQMALAFVNTRPFTTSTIVGATTVAQLEQDIGSADLTLPPDLLAQIETIHTQSPNPAP